jgi:hypothetical protein
MCVDEGGVRRGGELIEDDYDRFRMVTDVIATAIRDGAFPDFPGEYNGYFGNFTNCRWCDYDRICPVARGELWEGVRDDERVRRYAAVVDPREDVTG